MINLERFQDLYLKYLILLYFNLFAIELKHLIWCIIGKRHAFIDG